jgi:hypothetical protein
MKTQDTHTFMAKIYILTLATVFATFNSLAITTTNSYDWLNDEAQPQKAIYVQKNKLSTIDAFPRKSTGSIKNNAITAEQLATYDIYCSKPFGGGTKVLEAQVFNPNLSWLRIYCPQEWQGGQDGANLQGNGHPFNTSAEATENNMIFAGHFAYKPYTTLSEDLGTKDTMVLKVANAQAIQKGSYCVVRNADSWKNAEHVQVSKVNDPEGTITVVKRGYKSHKQDWKAGAIIAQHQIGNGTDNLNWCYNLSSRCPKDANGKKAYEVFAEWLVKNYDKDEQGKQCKAMVDGILYDSDAYAFIDGGGRKRRNADMDNDGVADWGYAEDGTNFWSEGLEAFYKGVREGLNAIGRKDIIIVGGVAESWGLLPNNGTQVEAAWSHQFIATGAPASAYNYIGFYMSTMKAQTAHGVIYPRVSDVQGKEISALYYGRTVETTNTHVRFSYAMTMMFDGVWFSNQNGFGDPFHYFDEDAVYTAKGENFGKSVLKTNTSDILKNSKWLGKALGGYKRVYDASAFDLSKNLFPNGDFEKLLTEWTGIKAAASMEQNNVYQGKACMKITPDKTNSIVSDWSAATVSSPEISLTADKEYTLCFAIYSESAARKVDVKIGAFTQELFVTPGWNKHVLTWKEKKSENSNLRFDVGGELSNVWVDQLYLFEGSADVFRRDFEKGVILANASNLPKTIKLEKGLNRIAGSLDAEVNNGEKNLSEITLAPHEGLFLVKQ